MATSGLPTAKLTCPMTLSRWPDALDAIRKSTVFRNRRRAGSRQREIGKLLLSKLQSCVAKAGVVTGRRRSRRSDHRVPVYQGGGAMLDRVFSLASAEESYPAKRRVISIVFFYSPSIFSFKKIILHQRVGEPPPRRSMSAHDPKNRALCRGRDRAAQPCSWHRDRVSACLARGVPRRAGGIDRRAAADCALWFDRATHHRLRNGVREFGKARCRPRQSGPQEWAQAEPRRHGRPRRGDPRLDAPPRRDRRDRTVCGSAAAM